MPDSEIIFTDSIAIRLKAFIEGKNYSAICLLVDENTERHCLPLLELTEASANIIHIRSGEKNKILSTCEWVWKEMTRLQLDRKALLINIGGGVIGDMGGFCAATYKRGIDFIQVPTTLLSQVDASVGGKLGIDFLDFKNHIGVFQNPRAVIIDTAFLKTLSREELRSGFAEVIKHCLIADRGKWDEIRKAPLEQQDWNELARHSVAIKSKVTAADPTEKGLRKILNFGHTVGHAIESYFLNMEGKRLLHGEAIAIGMACEAYIAFTKNFLSESDVKEISDYLFKVYGKKEISASDLENILPLTLHDKKNDHKTIQCSLLKKIGEANFDIPVTLQDIKDSLLYYNAQHATSENQLY